MSTDNVFVAIGLVCLAAGIYILLGWGGVMIYVGCLAFLVAAVPKKTDLSKSFEKGLREGKSE